MCHEAWAVFEASWGLKITLFLQYEVFIPLVNHDCEFELTFRLKGIRVKASSKVKLNVYKNCQMVLISERLKLLILDSEDGLTKYVIPLRKMSL